MVTRVGLGQSNHRFLPPDSTKPCVIGGIIFDDTPGFLSKSDGDVVFHALCNAITSLTGVQVIGEIATDLALREGITDSEIYLREALKILTASSQTIIHVAISLEAKKPQFNERIPEMRENIAKILDIAPTAIGISAISGEGLSDVSCGDGVGCLVLLTTVQTAP